MTAKIEIPAEKRQQAYEQYSRHPQLSIDDIATFLGVSASTFVRLRQRWGWPPRLAALEEYDRSKAAAEQADSLVGGMDAATSLREAARVLARAARAQIAAFVEEQRTGSIGDHDKTSRTLASYAKTLTTARELLEQEGSALDDTEHHEKPRRSIHELRDELAHHLERVIAEEEARGSDGLLV